MTDDVDADQQDGLLSRLSVIEDQNLDQRADAYSVLYDEIRSRLEGADAVKNQQWQTPGSTSL